MNLAALRVKSLPVGVVAMDHGERMPLAKLREIGKFRPAESTTQGTSPNDQTRILAWNVQHTVKVVRWTANLRHRAKGPPCGKNGASARKSLMHHTPCWFPSTGYGSPLPTTWKSIKTNDWPKQSHYPRLPVTAMLGTQV